MTAEPSSGQPSRLWPILGHEEAVHMLRRALEHGNPSHAYLLKGPQGIGKRTLALTFAQALNCQEPPGPCQQCAACRRIAAGNHADIRIIALPAGTNAQEETRHKEIGIDQVRELQRAAALLPYEGRARVFIIDDATHLSVEAANCLLKTLEEPPSSVFLFLLTTNEERLLPTVRSRCQQLGLRPLPLAVVEQALTERYNVSPQEALLLSRLSQGRLGWAFTMVQNPTRLTQRRHLITRMLHLLEGDLHYRLRVVAELSRLLPSHREALHETLDAWVGWWRDLLLVRAQCAELVVNRDCERELAQEAPLYPLRQIAHTLRRLQETWEQVEENVSPPLALGALMLDLPRKPREGREGTAGLVGAPPGG